MHRYLGIYTHLYNSLTLKILIFDLANAANIYFISLIFIAVHTAKLL